MSTTDRPEFRTNEVWEMLLFRMMYTKLFKQVPIDLSGLTRTLVYRDPRMSFLLSEQEHNPKITSPSGRHITALENLRRIQDAGYPLLPSMWVIAIHRREGPPASPTVQDDDTVAILRFLRDNQVALPEIDLMYHAIEQEWVVPELPVIRFLADIGVPATDDAWNVAVNKSILHFDDNSAFALPLEDTLKTRVEIFNIMLSTGVRPSKFRNPINPVFIPALRELGLF